MVYLSGLRESYQNSDSILQSLSTYVSDLVCHTHTRNPDINDSHPSPHPTTSKNYRTLFLIVTKFSLLFPRYTIVVSFL